MENNNTDEVEVFVSTHIVSFLLTHPLISVRGLEKATDAPNDTIRKAKEGKRNIPPKYFYKIGLILSNYGFDWPTNDSL